MDLSIFKEKFEKKVHNLDWGNHVLYLSKNKAYLVIFKNKESLNMELESEVITVPIKTKIKQMVCHHDKNLIYPYNDNTTFKICSKCLFGYKVSITPVDKLTLEYKQQNLKDLAQKIELFISTNPELESLIKEYNETCNEIEELDFTKTPEQLKLQILN